MQNITSVVFLILLLLIAFVMNGCAQQPEIKYIDRPYEVKVPVKCVVPKAKCNFNKPTDTEVISSMLKCIVDMKHNQEVCQ